jgi:hypothetical protein
MFSAVKNNVAKLPTFRYFPWDVKVAKQNKTPASTFQADTRAIVAFY